MTAFLRLNFHPKLHPTGHKIHRLLYRFHFACLIPQFLKSFVEFLWPSQEHGYNPCLSICFQFAWIFLNSPWSSGERLSCLQAKKFNFLRVTWMKLGHLSTQVLVLCRFISIKIHVSILHLWFVLLESTDKSWNHLRSPAEVLSSCWLLIFNNGALCIVCYLFFVRHFENM